MFVTFLESRRASEDGFTTKPCAKGVTYDLADTAARDAISRGWAREATDVEVQNLRAANLSEAITLTSFATAVLEGVLHGPSTMPQTRADKGDGL